MINEEILKKAIEKAVKNGFKINNYYLKGYFDDWFRKGEGRYKQENTIIFSHDFAKAFWAIEIDEQSATDQGSWADHLQQMVLEKEPLKYLEKFLPERLKAEKGEDEKSDISKVS